MKCAGKFVFIIALFLTTNVVFGMDSSVNPQTSTLWKDLKNSVEMNNFNLFASIIFLCGIIHTFCYGIFVKLSEKLRGRRHMKFEGLNETILHRFLHLLGEVEIILAFWLLPLFIGYIFKFGWGNFTLYIHEVAYVNDKYAEPVFVVAIMVMAGSKPVISLASEFVNLFARIGKGSIKGWWCSILLVGSILGSFITEPAAITICAILLMRHFFEYNPSEKFKYATMALLFIAVSVGGTLTHFAAPPVLMVARTWDWGTAYMSMHFGWKAVLGITLSILVYALIFKKEFAVMEQNKKDSEEKIEPESDEKIPLFMKLIHIGFITTTVLLMHHVVLVVLVLLAFVSFMDLTKEYQYQLNLRGPVLVGVFLAALVTHGAFQAWWIEPILMSLSPLGLFTTSIALTSFNDNAAITYLASLVSDFTEEMKYLVVAGAVTGGGLTIIANAPNLVGYSILKKSFKGSLSAKKLFKGAIIPTIIIAAIFFFIQ